jgi:hypothetical protein
MDIPALGCLDDDAIGPSPAAQRAADDVEWLAALWELTGGREARSANPGLLALLRFNQRLRAHPALAEVARERTGQSRDQLVKVVVRDAYGELAGPPALRAALAALRADLVGILGAGAHQFLEESRDEAARRVAAMAGLLDPAADMAALTGEHDPLRVVIAPSVFLPPPQSGRHGVLLRRADHWVVQLHFGFPLDGDPETFDINRPWLLGGAWHYAIDTYLMRHWPPIARRLADRLDLAEAFAAALPGRARTGEERSWTDSLRVHLRVAFKCLLSRRQGMPDGLHRAFARAAGLALFPWFEEWLLDAVSSGAQMSAVLAGFPEAFTAGRPRWEALGREAAARAADHPPTVNIALIAPAARRAYLVVPDEWSDDEAAAAAAGWRILSARLVRHSEWHRTRAADAPVIAFGEPARNPLVDRVLTQRGLSLDTVAGDAADPAIIALSMPGLTEAPWCVAVAVRRPDTAAMLSVEMALKQTSSSILFDGSAVISAERVPISELAAPAARAAGKP